MRAEEHINIGNDYLSKGQLPEAKQHYYQALRLDPQYAEGYHNLGRLFYLENLFDEAIPLFEKALRINPNYWEAHYNLAHTLSQKNQFNQAMVHYQEVLRLIPEHYFAHYNLGLILFESGDYEAALNHLPKAENSLAKPEDKIAVLYYIAHAHLSLGHVNEATDYFEKLIEFSDPLSQSLANEFSRQFFTKEKMGENHHNLAVLYLRQGRRSQALLHFEEALKYQPENDTAHHMVMAIKGSESALMQAEGLPSESKSESESESKSRAPKHYIADLFDQYADYYDLHVKEKLQYKVPGLLRNAMGRCIASASQNAKAGRVLDLGCGTGLCGIYFRDLALELIGVDLSPNMLEKAKTLGAYDELVEADILEYLASSDLQPFDIIIAGDVLVYFGNLEKAFHQVSKALLPKGRFTFTVESIENSGFLHTDTGVKNQVANKVANKVENQKEYVLNPTGRYAHASHYIHKLASDNQLSIELEEKIILRSQENKSIEGLLFVLIKA